MADDLPRRPFEVPFTAEAGVVYVNAIRGSQGAYRRGQLERAIEILSAGYEGLIDLQPHEHRFHKGFPLHQLGLWELEAQRAQEARSYFLLAFVEDSLTNGERSPDSLPELAAPAAQMLVFNKFNVSGATLLGLARELRTAQQQDVLYRDPSAALAEHAPEEPPALQEEIDPYVPAWRELAEFGTHLGNRVFVGGSYRTDRFMPALMAARDEARACGLDGVLVAEFKSPPGMDMRRKSLICLMACDRAIFDLSESGGHQIEFDKLYDFGVREVLVIYDLTAPGATSRVSSLTAAWFGPLKIEPTPYRTIPELREIVRGWLGCSDLEDVSDVSDRAHIAAEAIAGSISTVIVDGVTQFLDREERRRLRDADDG